MRNRHDYDDKYLYSRMYQRTRLDYDDKYLYSRMYQRTQLDYDDQYARGVVVCYEVEVSYIACLLGC